MDPAGSEQADILITTKFHDRCENVFGSRGQRAEDIIHTIQQQYEWGVKILGVTEVVRCRWDGRYQLRRIDARGNPPANL